MMITNAFLDLKNNYIIKLLDYCLQEATQGKKNDNSSKANTQLELGSMQMAVKLLATQLDSFPAIFKKDLHGKPGGSGEEDEDEGITAEVAMKVTKILGATDD